MNRVILGDFTPSMILANADGKGVTDNLADLEDLQRMAEPGVLKGYVDKLVPIHAVCPFDLRGWKTDYQVA